MLLLLLFLSTLESDCPAFRSLGHSRFGLGRGFVLLLGFGARALFNMAGLLQGCLPARCSSPVIVGFPANASFSRQAVSVRVAPRSLRLSICRGSSEKGSAGSGSADCPDVGPVPMVRIDSTHF